MSIGFMSDACLTSAKVTFLLDCQVVGLTPKSMRRYRNVLTKFIEFVGDITVKELKPDHVRIYFAELADRSRRYTSSNDRFGSHSLHKHYSVIRAWIRWLYAQKLITERSSFVKAPRWHTRSLTYC